MMPHMANAMLTVYCENKLNPEAEGKLILFLVSLVKFSKRKRALSSLLLNIAYYFMAFNLLYYPFNYSV